MSAFWSGVYVTLAIVACVTGVPSALRRKRQAAGGDGAYSAVAEAVCEGTELIVLYNDYSSTDEPYQFPEVSIIHKEFIPAAENIYTNETDLYAYLGGITKKIKNAIELHHNPDADPAKQFEDWESVIYQYLVSSDLFALKDDVMATWYQWALNWFYDKNMNPFMIQDGLIRIVSGDEAGAYWWLALNYLRSDDYFLNDGAAKDSYGILGQSRGASQISFVPKGGGLYEGRYPIHAGGVTYSVFSSNSEGYGVDFLNYLLLLELAEENPEAKVLVSPCMIKGDEYMIELNGKTYRIHGSGRFNTCQKRLNYYYDQFESEYDVGNGVEEEISTGNFSDFTEVGDRFVVDPIDPKDFGFVEYYEDSGDDYWPGSSFSYDSYYVTDDYETEDYSSGGFGGYSSSRSWHFSYGGVNGHSSRSGHGESVSSEASGGGYIRGKAIPKFKNTKMYAMGIYDTTFRALGVIDEDGKVDVSLLEEKTKEFSNKTMSEILSENPNLDFTQISKIYQLGTYAPKILESYGFNSDSSNLYTPRNKEGTVSNTFHQGRYEDLSDAGGELGWTIGAALANLPNRQKGSCTCTR